MRLYAIEYLATTCFALVCLSRKPSDPMEVFERWRNAIIDGARKKTLPRFDPAMSDLVSAELEAALARLLDDMVKPRLLGLKSSPNG